MQLASFSCHLLLSFVFGRFVQLIDYQSSQVIIYNAIRPQAGSYMALPFFDNYNPG